MAADPQEKNELNINLRFYQPGDEENIVKLLVDVFGQWPVFDLDCSLVDHWKWKFIDNPASKYIDSHVVVDYDGKIIGVTHGMWFYTKLGDGRYFCSKGADLAIDPNYRKLGLYTKITKIKRDANEKNGAQFNYSLTTNPILKHVQSKRVDSFNFPYPLNNFLKIENVDDFLTHTRKENKFWRKLYLKSGLVGLKLLNRLTNIRLGASEPSDFRLREVTVFDERIEKFYDKVKSSYHFIVEKKMEYMNWRYCDKRGGDYRVWLAEKDDEVIGYLVLRINSLVKSNPIGFIIDVLALDGREDVVDHFVKFAVDYFKERDLNVVRAQLVLGNKYERILSRHGFIDNRERMYLTYRPIDVGADLDKFKSAPASMIHYPYGESDSI